MERMEFDTLDDLMMHLRFEAEALVYVESVIYTDDPSESNPTDVEEVWVLELH